MRDTTLVPAYMYCVPLAFFLPILLTGEGAATLWLWRHGPERLDMPHLFLPAWACALMLAGLLDLRPALAMTASLIVNRDRPWRALFPHPEKLAGFRIRPSHSHLDTLWVLLWFGLGVATLAWGAGLYLREDRQSIQEAGAIATLSFTALILVFIGGRGLRDIRRGRPRLDVERLPIFTGRRFAGVMTVDKTYGAATAWLTLRCHHELDSGGRWLAEAEAPVDEDGLGGSVVPFSFMLPSDLGGIFTMGVVWSLRVEIRDAATGSVCSQRFSDLPVFPP